MGKLSGEFLTSKTPGQSQVVEATSQGAGKPALKEGQ